MPCDGLGTVVVVVVVGRSEVDVLDVSGSNQQKVVKSWWGREVAATTPIGWAIGSAATLVLKSEPPRAVLGSIHPMFSFCFLPSCFHHQNDISDMDFMQLPAVQRLTPPAVTALVVFLAHSSQWLFYHIEPGPLRKGDAYLFNTLVACLLICYWRTCLTDPGRIPKDWHERVQDVGSKSQQSASAAAAQSNRWCRKCETFKPPRAHHCKTCKR